MYVVLLFVKRIAERAANIRAGCISFGMIPANVRINGSVWRSRSSSRRIELVSGMDAESQKSGRQEDTTLIFNRK